MDLDGAGRVGRTDVDLKRSVLRVQKAQEGIRGNERFVGSHVEHDGVSREEDDRDAEILCTPAWINWANCPAAAEYS